MFYRIGIHQTFKSRPAELFYLTVQAETGDDAAAQGYNDYLQTDHFRRIKSDLAKPYVCDVVGIQAPPEPITETAPVIETAEVKPEPKKKAKTA